MTKKNQKIDWKVIVAGIICLTIIECFAMVYGFNGTMRMIIIGIICLAIGVNIPKDKFFK